MLTPTQVKFTGDAKTHFKGHLRSRILSINRSMKTLRETKLPEWRRMYEGRPAATSRHFPFRNASNLVVPLTAIHCDTLQARLMAALWRVLPIFPAKLYGRYEDKDLKHFNDVKVAWEEWMAFNAIEPEQLNLRQVEEEWIAEICRYGTSVVKIVNEKRERDMWVPAGDSLSGSDNGEVVRETLYDGPMPQKLAFEDFGLATDVARWEDSDILVHRVRLKKHQLMDRRYRGVYDAKAVDDILGHPDLTTSDYVTKQRQTDAKLAPEGEGYAEWHIYECWLNWRSPGQKYAPAMIASYHLKSDTLARAIYDFHPDKPFVVGRLLYRDDSVLGYGLCEALAELQEEVSQIHNQRRDNQTIANTKVWRVNPLSKLHEGYEVYPGAMIPAEKDEIEPMVHGEVSEMSIEEERLSLDLAERRSGVSPPMQGFGAAQQGKRGVYSATGTMSMLQEGNRRTDLTISDIRYAHLKIGRIISRQYAMLGLHDKSVRMFGAQADVIREGAELIKAGRLGLVVSNSSASVNKEVEKQNVIMLTQIMGRHYQMVATLIQSINSSMAPEPLKQYLVKVADASNMLIKKVLRDFDIDETDLLVPEATNVGQPTQAPPSGAGTPGGTSGQGLQVLPGGLASPQRSGAPQIGPAVGIVPGAGAGRGTS